MNATLRIRRTGPGEGAPPRWQEYQVSMPEGSVVLEALHEIHDRQDPTLAYRYSCRGAICGSCAMRIQGVAALACKTQLASVAEEGGTVVLEPLSNLPVVRDLVVEQGPFFEAMRSARPWLASAEERELDAPLDYGEGMTRQELDQWRRSLTCIRCQACFSDCPKRAEAPRFIGPAACVDIYKYAMDPRSADAEERLQRAQEPGGVQDCDRHANCVKVCPKDVRPMRAIQFLRKRAEG